MAVVSNPCSTLTFEAVLTFEHARQKVEEHAAQLQPVAGRELLALLDAAGRVLAEPIHADRNFPPFRRAARDGYAIRAADTEGDSFELEVVGEVKAGAANTFTVEGGQAVSIMTGAAVPAGADAVAMVEHTSRTGDRVRVERRLGSGENIVPEAAEAKRGDQLLAPGTRVGYAEVAVASSVGRSRVVVHDRPRVAVISTGDAVVDIDVPPCDS